MSTPSADDPSGIQDAANAPDAAPAPTGGEVPDAPDTDSAASPAPSGDAASAPTPTPPRRHREAAALGREVREVRGEVDELRRKTRELSDDAAADRRAGRSTAGELAELIPRVDDIDERVAALAAHVAQSAPRAGDRQAGAGDGDDADAAPVTPAAGWNDMDRDTAQSAWEALARFVGDVLYDQYRLSRLQIPDCWPLHPRMVRELAWLRSQYVAAKDAEAEEPGAAAGWHIRSLPSLFINTADAVDQRECRPGIHRLTEPEVDDQLGRREEAAARHDAVPEPSTETGPDRPRLRPEHFPTRSTTPQRGRSSSTGPPAPTAKTLPDLIVGPCSPEHWLEFYREASYADLAGRSAPDEVAETVDDQGRTNDVS